MIEQRKIPIIIDVMSSRHSIAIQTIKFIRNFFDNPIFILSDKVVEYPVANATLILRKKDCLPLMNMSRFAEYEGIDSMMYWPEDTFVGHANMQMIERFLKIFLSDENVGFFNLHKIANSGKKYNNDNDVFIASRKMRWYLSTNPFFVRRNFLSFVAIRSKTPWLMEKNAIARAKKHPMIVLHTNKECYKLYNFIKRGYVTKHSYEFAKKHSCDFSGLNLRLFTTRNNRVYQQIGDNNFAEATKRLIMLSNKYAGKAQYKSDLYKKAAKLLKMGKLKQCLRAMHETHKKCEW